MTNTTNQYWQDRWATGQTKFTQAQIKDIHGVYDRASLFALPAELRQRYATLMNTCLPAHTQMLLLTFLYDETTMQGPPFCVKVYCLEKLP